MPRAMVDVSKITTTASLLEALDGRDAEDKAAFDEAIWAARGREAAVLVTDLSGFTRLTKKHGILHFLAVFRRCERACLPVVAEHGGQLMKHEADDLICLFDDAVQAIGAAFAMLRACAAINESLEPDERVHLCLGVESGRLLRLDDDAFGDPVNVAFKLGEDVAEKGEVLIGPNAYASARDGGFDFTGVTVDGPRVVETGNVPLEHWAATLASN